MYHLTVGYADVAIKVESRGGHSSVPGPHTAIGFLARFISALEDADIYSPILTRENPYYGYLHCLDQYGSEKEVPDWLHGVLERDDVAEIARCVASIGPRSRFIIETSKAATVVHGGVKNNALPEEAEVVFNSRIEVGNSTQRVADCRRLRRWRNT
jgi:Gly-Xaa carboxypeptidase